jgi:hypothetical protein
MAGSAAQRTMERMGNLNGAGVMGDIVHSLEQRLCGEAARRGIGVSALKPDLSLGVST